MDNMKPVTAGAWLHDLQTFQALTESRSAGQLQAERHLLPQRLTDATLDGGLFGIRFEPPRGEQAQGEVPRRRRSSRTELA